jgi:hypothetical protein
MTSFAPLAMFVIPQLTAASGPLAVLLVPPLTEALSPLAVFSRPPLTAANIPLISFNLPTTSPQVRHSGEPCRGLSPVAFRSILRTVSPFASAQAR